MNNYLKEIEEIEKIFKQVSKDLDELDNSIEGKIKISLYNRIQELKEYFPKINEGLSIYSEELKKRGN